MAVYIHDSSIISPLGFSTKANFNALLQGKSAIEKVFINDTIGSVFCGKINDDDFNSYFKTIDDRFEGTRIDKLLIAALSPIVEINPVINDSVLILSIIKVNSQLLVSNV